MGIFLASAGRLLMMGLPMGLQFSITAIGTMMVQAAVNLLGATYIAAFSAGGKICNIVTLLFPSLGVTLATYVGQNMGAGKIKRIRQGVRTPRLSQSSPESSAVWRYLSGAVRLQDSLLLIPPLRSRPSVMNISMRRPGAIRFSVPFSSTGTRFREWETGWCHVGRRLRAGSPGHHGNGSGRTLRFPGNFPL